MSQTYISKQLRQLVFERANASGEYCLLPEEVLPSSFHVDHIILEKQGGLTEIKNLALACARCNILKGSDISAYLPDREIIVDLYNCKKDIWQDHFTLSPSGEMMPVSLTGEGTIRLLRLNRSSRVEIRKMLLEAGYNLVPKMV